MLRNNMLHKIGLLFHFSGRKVSERMSVLSLKIICHSMPKLMSQPYNGAGTAIILKIYNGMIGGIILTRKMRSELFRKVGNMHACRLKIGNG